MTAHLALMAAILFSATVANAEAPSPLAAPVPSAAAPAPGQSQSPPMPPAADQARFRAFVGTPFYQGLIKQSLETVPVNVFVYCPTLVTGGAQITVLRPFQFAENGSPTAGVWKHSVPVSGCGPAVTLNFFFMVTAEQKINAFIGAPGSTRADPGLQRSAIDVATAGAIAALQELGGPPCPTYAIKNTSFQAFGLDDPPTPDPGPVDRYRPWSENWTISGCGRVFLVPLNFMPRAGAAPQITQPGHVTQAPLEDPGTIAPSPYGPQATPPAGDPPSAKP